MAPFSSLERYSSRLDVPQFPCQQQADKQQYRQSHAQCQGPDHALPALLVVFAVAHHEEQRCPKAGENGEKTQSNKYLHGSNYPVSAKNLRRTRATFWIITLATCVGVLVTAALGRWQLSRVKQKESLAAEMTARTGAAALEGEPLLQALAPVRTSKDHDAVLYRQVHLRGRWLPQYTVYLDNRPMDGRRGFYVLTPLQLAPGPLVVLVQRGWIPRNFENRTALAPIETPVGEVEVTGHLALEPEQAYSLGSDQTEQGFLRIRQNLTLGELRTETGLPLAALTVVQEGAASQGLLRDWAPISTGVEKNYGYAFQWFVLSGLILGLYVWFQFVRPRRRA